MQRMEEISPSTQNPMSFAKLMRLGQVAHAQGNLQEAHRFWKQASLLQPDNEQEWISLLQTLNSKEDQQICLKNILVINPDNSVAQANLDQLLGKVHHTTLENVPEQASLPHRLSRYLGRIVLEVLILLAIISAVLVAAQYLN